MESTVVEGSVGSTVVEGLWRVQLQRGLRRV